VYQKYYIDNYGYCQSNLDVLQDFIDNSSNSVGGDLTDHTLSLGLDLGYDGIGGTNDDGEGDGIIHPLELAPNNFVISEWVEGRLEMWDCENCGLSGSIPESIGQLSYLRNLDLSHNLLSGKIPANFGNMSQLTNINLRNNYLSGDIPDNFINFMYNMWTVDGGAQYASGNFATDLGIGYLANNYFCEPYSDLLLDILSWPSGVHYLESQGCEPMLRIIYPIEDRPRYAENGSTPVALIVNNFVVGHSGCGSDCDGHFHWIIANSESSYFKT
jgi:hypothetical protein